MFGDFVKGLNSINSNVWAFLVLLIGVFLTIKGDVATGEALLMGGFGVLHGTGTQEKKEENNGTINISK